MSTLFSAITFPDEKRPRDDGRVAGGTCSTCAATMFWTHNPITGVWTPLVKRENADPHYVVILPEMAPELVQLKPAIEIPAVTWGQLLKVTKHLELVNGERIPAELLSRFDRISHFRTCTNPARHSRR